MSTAPSRRRGFTLIEFFVVLGIITVLIALLMPALQKARAVAARTDCASRLHNLGLAFEMYKQEHGRRYPVAAQFPGIGQTLPSLPEVLGVYAENNTAIFHCPNDLVYFPKVGISYEYPSQVSGNILDDVDPQGRGTSQIWILYDYGPFHGAPFSGKSRNFLYADGHVS